MKMDFQEWMKASYPSVDLTKLTPANKQYYQSMWRNMATEADNLPTADEVGSADAITALADQYAVGCRFDNPDKAARFHDLANSLIARNATMNEAKLEMLRLDRTRKPITMPRLAPGAGESAAIEAGLLQSFGISESAIEGIHDAATMQTARDRGYHRMTLHSLLRLQLQSAGRHVPAGKLAESDIRDALRLSAGMSDGGYDAPMQTGWSTINVTGILSNTANKAALLGFTAVGTTYQKFCRKSSVDDFKERSSFRMTTKGSYALVPAGGEIPHVTLEEASAKNKADTYGARLAITRTDLVNDDLSMFATVPGSLGRLGALAIERAVYVLLLANTGNFFAAGNKNLLTGVDSALSLLGIGKAVAAFQEQTDLNGDPTLLAPAVLLHPSPLNAAARELMNSGTIVATSTVEGMVPEGNPWKGLADPVSSPFLGTTLGLTGGSNTAWYLLVAPGDFAIIDVAFLEGRESPIVEANEVDFAKLGMEFRSYHDWGAAFLEHRGGVKSAGG